MHMPLLCPVIHHGHLGCFHILDMWVMLQWTWECKSLFEIPISVFVDIYIPRRGISGTCGSICNFSRSPHAVFCDGCTILHSFQQCIRVQFSLCLCHCLPLCFYKCHPNSCEVISHCGFHLHFHMINDVEHPFITLLATWMYFLKKDYSSSLPIFNWVIVIIIILLLSCMYSLYILDINPLSDI